MITQSPFAASRRGTLVALCACVGWAFLGLAPPAQAQVSAADKAAAEALFDQGLALMRQGSFAEACVKLEQSEAVDRGIGTMLYLAECYEKSGRTASAWALFRQAASEAAASGESERATAGRQRAERLKPLLSTLTLKVANGSTPGLELLRDGEQVMSALWGVPVPVDPGTHRIEARASGFTSWSASVQVPPNAASVVLGVPALAPAPAPPPAVAAQGAPPPSEAAAAPAPTPAPAPLKEAAGVDARATQPPPPRRGSGQRIVGLVISGAGVVALGIGTGFGLHAIARNNDAKHHCPGGGATCTDQRGVKLTQDAQDAAQLANVFVIGGAVLAAAGIVTYFLAPPGAERAVGFASDGRSARVTLEGAF